MNWEADYERSRERDAIGPEPGDDQAGIIYIERGDVEIALKVRGYTEGFRVVIDGDPTLLDGTEWNGELTADEEETAREAIAAAEFDAFEAKQDAAMDAYEARMEEW
jgi:hypothetical protein